MARGNRNFKDITGQNFGRLEVVTRSDAGNSRNRTVKWLCKCSCGNDTIVCGSELRRGKVKSCGCLRHDAPMTHGMEHTVEYTTWLGIKARCKSLTLRRNYSERGITVCPEWRESFEAFFASVGPRPSSKHSLDRIDNDGNYEPGNCRWATRTEQNRNRRNTRKVTIDGVEIPLAEAVERFGGKYATVLSRLHRGWSHERCLGLPPTTALILAAVYGAFLFERM